MNENTRTTRYEWQMVPLNFSLQFDLSLQEGKNQINNSIFI